MDTSVDFLFNVKSVVGLLIGVASSMAGFVSLTFILKISLSGQSGTIQAGSII